MWMLLLIFRTLTGFWRLLIGLAIGVFLYVYTFLYYDTVFSGVHDLTREMINWLKVQPHFVHYAKWNEILKIQDKLAFAFYVLFGRIVWMLIEELVFKLPYWLLIGRWREKRKRAALAQLKAEKAPVAKRSSEPAAPSALQPPAERHPAPNMPQPAGVAPAHPAVAPAVAPPRPASPPAPDAAAERPAGNGDGPSGRSGH